MTVTVTVTVTATVTVTVTVSDGDGDGDGDGGGDGGEFALEPFLQATRAGQQEGEPPGEPDGSVRGAAAQTEERSFSPGVDAPRDDSSSARSGPPGWPFRSSRCGLGGEASPNEKIRIAAIGVGGKGWTDVRKAAEEGNEVVAFCDVVTRPESGRTGGWGAAAERWPKARG